MADTKQVNQPIELPFWSKREGFVARECNRCGHRGTFLFTEDPVMVSENVMCMSCGSVTFKLVVEDPTGDTIEEIFEQGTEDPDGV